MRKKKHSNISQYLIKKLLEIFVKIYIFIKKNVFYRAPRNSLFIKMYYKYLMTVHNY